MVWSASERDGLRRPTCRRCAAGWSSTSRPRRPSGSSSSAPAGCATSSSPSSCCSWCTAAPTRRCARRRRCRALAELTRGGYVGREDGAALARRPTAFLRTLEHRMQLCAAAPHPRRARGRGVAAPARAARWGCMQGARSRSSTRSGAGTAARCAGCTRSSSTGRCSPRSPGCPADEARLSPEAAEQRLAALGYEDPKAALRHLEALTSGVSRTASIQRTLLPAMLELVRRRARTRTPGCSASGRSPRRSARRTGTSRRCATRARSPSGWRTVLATSRYATDLLQRAPEGVRMLGHRRGAASRWAAAALQKEMTVGRRAGTTDPVEAVTAVRAIRRRELFRIAVADLFGLARRRRGRLRPHRRHRRATLEAALAAAMPAVEAERRGAAADPDGDRGDGPATAATSWATAATPT